MRFLVRVAVLLVLFCLPFLLYTFVNRRREHAGLALVVPFMLGIPLALSAMVVFAPIERYFDARSLGHLKNGAVPILGGIAVALFMVSLLVLLAAFEPGPERRPRNALTIRQRVPRVLVTGGAFGVVGGTLWRLTDWVAGLLGM